MREAVLTRFAESALKGDIKAAGFLLQRYDMAEAANEYPTDIATQDEQEIIDAFLQSYTKEKVREMTYAERAFHDAILRRHFELFLRRCLMTLNPGHNYLPNWHIQAIAHQLKRIWRGEITRLIINMPPRHLKSLTVSVAFPAFLLGLEPWHRIFVVSYGSDLSSKHASDFRSIVESRWYHRAFNRLRIARSLEDEVSTTARGFRKSTSVYGTLTGLGGDVFIIDDPQKPVDAQSDAQRNRLNHWFSNTLMSRLDSKEKGIIIVVMQRVHLNDLSGYLMEFRRVGGFELACDRRAR